MEAAIPAGQAVVFLAPKVKRLHLVVRGPGLEVSMSRYLIDRIAALPNVELHTGTEVSGFEGDEATGLNAVVFRERSAGAMRTCPLRHLFLFIGADPNASWLNGCVAVDSKGFVVTGGNFARATAADSHPALPLETQARPFCHWRCACRLDKARRCCGRRRGFRSGADSEHARSQVITLSG